MQFVTYNGETLSVPAWAKRLGMKRATLARRLRHWSVEKALATPAGPPGVQRKDMAGQRFGHWKVLEYVSKSRWRCRCACGREREVDSRNLRSGKSTRCIDCHLNDILTKRVNVGCHGSRFITFNGRTLYLSQWVRETGISKRAISYRLKVGWTVEEALTIPPNRRNRRPTAPASRPTP